MQLVNGNHNTSRVIVAADRTTMPTIANLKEQPATFVIRRAACLKKKNGGGSCKNTKHLTTASDDSDVEEFNLHTVGLSTSKPIMLTLAVEGRDLDVELDTGAF